MYYILITIILLIGLFIYFRIAEKYKIIDCPNERSSHKVTTIRGGGIIYPLSYIIFLITLILHKEIEITYFIIGLGLLIISTVSFIDDIVKLSPGIRLVFHFISVSILLYSIGGFSLSIWLVPIYYILIIGILNSYNFMDGINGMTGLYSLVTLSSLYFVNENYHIFSVDFILFPIIASMVFLFFNFRKKAKCFAGDVGSFSIAFWILVIIGSIIVYTDDYKYLLLLTVYGIDSIFTIVERLLVKENILEAHRRHLYQLFVNEKQISHLVVSFSYAAIQLVINFLLIYFDLSLTYSLLLIVLPTALIYLIIKYTVKKSLHIS